MGKLLKTGLGEIGAAGIAQKMMVWLESVARAGAADEMAKPIAVAMAASTMRTFPHWTREYVAIMSSPS